MSEFQKNKDRYEQLFAKAGSGQIESFEIGELLGLGQLIINSLQGGLQSACADLVDISLAHAECDQAELEVIIQRVSKKFPQYKPKNASIH
jgi:hypothetical protein